MNCFLDKKEAVDSFEVEAGNNAEIGVVLNVCQEHLEEAEKLDYGFQEKYGIEIERIVNERIYERN